MQLKKSQLYRHNNRQTVFTVITAVDSCHLSYFHMLSQHCFCTHLNSLDIIGWLSKSFWLHT